MLTPIIALAALAGFVTAFPTQVAPRDLALDSEKCYTLSISVLAEVGNKTVERFLDTQTTDLISHNLVRSVVEDGLDKGVRFRFPDGQNGPVVSQAHNDHNINIHWKKKYLWSTPWKWWQASADTTNTDVLKVYLTEDRNGVFLKQGSKYVDQGDNDGDHAKVVDDPVKWDTKEVNCITLEE